MRKCRDRGLRVALRECKDKCLKSKLESLK